MMGSDKKNYSIDENILNQVPFPSFALNREGEVVIWNELCEKYFSYSMQDFLNTPVQTIKHNLLSGLSENSWDKILERKETYRFEKIQLLTKDDRLLNSSLLSIPCFIDGVPCTQITCILSELVVKLDETAQELLDLKEGIHSSFMVVTLDSEGLIINCNQAFLKTSHWTPKRVLGKTFWQLFPETDESLKMANQIWQTISSGQIWQGDIEKITKDGALYWVNLTAIPTYSQEDAGYRFVLIEQDITKDKELQHKLEKIAYMDTETGLMNVHRLEKVVTEIVEEGRHFSFVYMSIDKFYTIKDLHHNLAENNNLIVEFTKRMKIYFQDSLMARINENDFVVITPLGEWFIQGFLTYLKQNPIFNGSEAVPIAISGGITRAPQDQTNFSQLMKASLATIANVRKAGGDHIVSLSNETHKAINRRSMIEKRLLLALDQRNLKVLYQPQVDLQSGKITGVEALVRWEDEKIGVVSPDELIPIAEETGLIHHIGSFVIEKASRQAVEWQSKGLNLKVSINLSVREFRDKNMAKSILSTLAKVGCPANIIQIEITEKFALEAEAETSIIKQMRQLEDQGITFVLDDFGTGYASFRYMQLLPIEVLKIDKTFIRSLMQSEKTQRLINGMVHFGNSMNLTVLAEGVETEEQKELLKSYGCDAIQGYLVSKAVSEDEISELVKK